MEQIAFLGHIISKDGLAVDPSKVEAIVSWQSLMNVAKIKSFLGLAGYYRRFFRDFNSIDQIDLQKCTLHLDARVQR